VVTRRTQIKLRALTIPALPGGMSGYDDAPEAFAQEGLYEKLVADVADVVDVVGRVDRAIRDAAHLQQRHRELVGV
jgi:hypothetical protein